MSEWAGGSWRFGSSASMYLHLWLHSTSITRYENLTLDNWLLSKTQFLILQLKIEDDMDVLFFLCIFWFIVLFSLRGSTISKKVVEFFLFDIKKNKIIFSQAPKMHFHAQKHGIQKMFSRVLRNPFRTIRNHPGAFEANRKHFEINFLSCSHNLLERRMEWFEVTIRQCCRRWSRWWSQISTNRKNWAVQC